MVFLVKIKKRPIQTKEVSINQMLKTKTEGKRERKKRRLAKPNLL